jgi:hypothetical protein
MVAVKMLANRNITANRASTLRSRVAGARKRPEHHGAAIAVVAEFDR